MEPIIVVLLVVFIAFAVSAILFPPVLKFAKAHDIVDNPNARKLQRFPVPVLGGFAVYTGILAGVLLLTIFVTDPEILWGLAAMTIMLMVGTWDDISEVSPVIRFAIEILLVFGLVYFTGIYIDDFHGLFGVYALPEWVGISLSVFAGVGVINAVNLIDGVDGYSSGYGMLACGCFAILFWYVGAVGMACFSLIALGALLPFFLHNVFGVKSKMFIGDGGTLMLGMLMTTLSFYALSGKTECDPYEKSGLCLTALVLAIGCIPVFDTLRVMTMRILRGRSPFKPDKTHLHHLFIDMDFSHLGAALSILFINAMVVVALLMAWMCGASIDVQFLIVMVLGIAVTFGFYKFMKNQQGGGALDEEGYPQGTHLWHMICRIGDISQLERKRFWRIMRYKMDGPMMLNRIYKKPLNFLEKRSINKKS